jgi:hypothetical protein
MKCDKCGQEYDLGRPDASIEIMPGVGPYAMSVMTNCAVGESVPADKFRTVFSFWDHRRQQERHICGSCLCQALGI